MCGGIYEDVLDKTPLPQEIYGGNWRNTDTDSLPPFRENAFLACFVLSPPLNLPFVPKNLHRVNIKIEYGLRGA